MSSDAEVQVTRGANEKPARVDRSVNGAHFHPGVEVYSIHR